MPAALVLLLVSIAPLLGQELTPPDREPYRAMDGEALFQAGCANCHGTDGTGADPTRLAFEEELPDFTDCAFASREPDADWIAVAHQGGPVRAFSSMMPAFGGILDENDLQRVMDYIRTLCTDASWPRGELNLPRAHLTEKAFPEDEFVWEVSSPLEGDDRALFHDLVYEKRFGPRSQIEVVVPFGVRQRGGEGGRSDDWLGGLGDIVLGFKHALYHSLPRGSIVSGGAEVKLPTGKEEDGFGGGTTVFELFTSYGQILPAESFFQFQGVLEFPTAEGAPNEGVLRGVIGTTRTEGPWGRAWSPMLELQTKRELTSGEDWSLDLLPQIQVTLNTRQHIVFNVGIAIPVTDSGDREAQLHLYLLWDWFDGGFFDGW